MGSEMCIRDSGVASWRLGAGRARKEDPVQAGAGIEILVDRGQKVTKGTPLFTLHSEDTDRFERALESLNQGWSIAPSEEGVPTPRQSVVIEKIN